MSLIPERGFLLNTGLVSGYGVGPVNGEDLIISGYGSWQGMVHWNRAGDGSASATLFGSPHPDMGWFPISSMAITGQGSAILSANYGHLRASIFWVAANPTAFMFGQWAR